MNKLSEKIYSDFHNGLYFYSKEKKKQDEDEGNKENGKLHAPEAHNLQNLFVTAVEHCNEEEVHIHSRDKSKYANLINKFSIRGIQIETKKTSTFEYGYVIHIKPKTVLGELEKFRIS